MDLSFEQIREISALAMILIVVFVAVWWGIPALFTYLKRKDAEHREEIMSLIAAHREDIQSYIASSREERDTFYKNLGLKLDRIHDRLDRIEISVTAKTP